MNRTKRADGQFWLLAVIGILMAGCAHSTNQTATDSKQPADASAAGAANMPASAEHDVLFNQQWKFYKGDDAKAQDPAFDDATWRIVDLPHDWSIEGPFDQNLASCTGFLPCGTAWYRKTFTVPESSKDKSVVIRFDGVMNHSSVWCNGQPVGGRAYGFTSFTCDLTPAIRPGDKNVVAVRVDHNLNADSRWYIGSGIYRNVFLTTTDKVHVATNGTFVTTPTVTAETATARIQTTVMNQLAAPSEVTVISTVQDAAGATVGSAEQSGTIPANGQGEIVTSVQVSHPALWSPDSPQMYTVQTKIKRKGGIVDQYKTPFGIRTFVFDPATGFSINGQSMKLKGVCLHADAGALGAAIPIEVWDRRLTLLKQGGCNAIRCSHNPPAPEFLDLCDRLGFLVMDEAFDEWTKGKNKWLVTWSHGRHGQDGYHSDFEQWADADIHDMVVRDRNHPSIIMWNIGNEIDGTNDPYPRNSPELPPIAQRLINDVKAVDTSRPVTAACAAPATNLFKKLLDIEGYNYMEGLYARDHAAHPDRVIYGSENGHGLSAWQAVEKNDYIAGQFLWTGIDYLGESNGWPAHGTDFGLIDLAGFTKTDYYYRQSLWSSEPMVHIAPSGLTLVDRNASKATEDGIYCFTNCDEVELFHDGQSLGIKHHAPGEVLKWPTPFTGSFKAVATRGSDTANDDLKKAGPPTKLMVKTDSGTLQDSLSANKRVAQVEVDVTDDQGTLVPDAANTIQVQLAGPGHLLGIENGDIRSTESYQDPAHSVYHGHLMIYVQLQSGEGDLKLTVTSPNLTDGSISLAMK